MIQRYDRLYDARPSQTVSLGNALEAICHGLYRRQVAHLRGILRRGDLEGYRQTKNRLPTLTFSGTFHPTRAKGHLQQHSGIVHADLDHLSDLQQVKLQLHLDPHVVYVFRSPSGDGLKYGVRITPLTTDAAYQHAWQTVCESHQDLYTITWDPSGKDVCRLCFVSWDPSCCINPDAVVYPVLPPPAPRPTAVPMSCHWPSPRLQSAAQRVLDRAERRVAAAPEGSRHEARLKASYLVGGYLASTDLSHDEALARLTTVALANTDDAREARRDIADGLTAGQSRPIITPPTRRRRGDWHGRAITPYEDPPWRK